MTVTSFTVLDSTAATKTVYTNDDPSTGAAQTTMNGAVTESVRTSTATLTRPANTTAYAANQIISDNSPPSGGNTFANVVRSAGKGGEMLDLMVVSSNPAGGLQMEVLVYDAAITNQTDRTAFDTSDAEAATLVARIPVTLSANGTSNASGHTTGLASGFTTVGNANLRFVPVARSAYTPISGEVFTFRLKTAPVG